MSEPGGHVEVSGPSGRRLEWGVAGRPHHEEQLSGDAWGAFGRETCATFAMVDGAGHGPLAHGAAVRAVESIEHALGLDDGEALHRVMRDCHVALAGTRGAAVALLRIQAERRKATFCGVGNIAIHVHPPRRNSGVSLPGTVGYRIPTLRVLETDLIPGDVWWMWTDGLSSRLPFDRYLGEPPLVAARRALQDFGRREDDATVMVIRFGSVGPLGTGAAGASRVAG